MVTEANTMERFKNRREALTWLQSRGQISQGKFYDDCAAGIITVYQDKSVSKFDVAIYAEKLFKAVRQTPDSDEMNREKEQLELQKLRLEVAKREHETRREDDKWLLKEEAWAQMAAIIGVLRDALRYQFHNEAAQIVHVAAGDQARVMELYQFCEETIGRAFNQVADRGRIEGVFVSEQTNKANNNDL